MDAAGLAVAEVVVATLDRVRVLRLHPRPARNGRRVALLGLLSESQRGDQQNHREQRNYCALHFFLLLVGIEFKYPTHVLIIPQFW